MWKIKYNYDSGDSFNTYNDIEGELELTWNNKEVAEQNLKRIEEHYKQYREVDSFRRKTPHQDIFKKNLDKDWFVASWIPIAFTTDINNYHVIDEGKEEEWIKNGYSISHIIDTMAAQNQIILYTDEGKPWQIWPLWCGYFESLNYVELVEDNKRINFK